MSATRPIFRFLIPVLVGVGVVFVTPHASSGATAASQAHTPRFGYAPPLYIPAELVDEPVVAADYLRAQAVLAKPDGEIPVPEGRWRRQGLVLNGAYAVGFALSTQMGTRLGLDNDYRIKRLETAYMYDLFAHAYVVKNLGEILGSFHRWAGQSPRQARRRGAWLGAFSMLTYMEVLNGFMPTVRFDPLDVPANAAGAWMADGGQDIVSDYPWLEKVSLQFGYKSVHDLFKSRPRESLVDNTWHDYTNGRWGLGVDVGRGRSIMFTMFLTYELTSMDIATMKNRFGMGVEFPVVGWLAPLIEKAPGGRDFMGVYGWLDRRLLIPGLYLQLFHVDTGPWSDQQPFRE